MEWKRNERIREFTEGRGQKSLNFEQKTKTKKKREREREREKKKKTFVQLLIYQKFVVATLDHFLFWFQFPCLLFKTDSCVLSGRSFCFLHYFKSCHLEDKFGFCWCFCFCFLFSFSFSSPHTLLFWFALYAVLT